MSYINVREHRKSNQKWIIQRNWQHTRVTVTQIRYLCLFAYSGVQHILCCFCFVFLRLVYHSTVTWSFKNKKKEEKLQKKIWNFLDFFFFSNRGLFERKVVCSSSIYGFWLTLCYFQTFLVSIITVH
jgi:hypothetical protein